MVVGEGDVALHFGAGGLGEVFVEGEPVDVAGEVFDVTGDTGIWGEVFAA